MEETWNTINNGQGSTSQEILEVREEMILLLFFWVNVFPLQSIFTLCFNLCIYWYNLKLGESSLLMSSIRKKNSKSNYFKGSNNLTIDPEWLLCSFKGTHYIYLLEITFHIAQVYKEFVFFFTVVNFKRTHHILMLIHFLKYNETYQVQSKQKAENKWKHKLKTRSHVKENCLWQWLYMRRKSIKGYRFLNTL